nr:helix-turn-helix transcriptional regulator [Amycolatopsis sp. MEP2-6]
MPDAGPGEPILGDHLRRLRTERHLSRRRLATAAGIPASRIERLERQQARWTSLSDTAAVADALAIPRADLAVSLLHDYQIHYRQPPKRLYDMLMTPIDALATQPFGDWIRTERHARGLTVTDLHYLSLLPQDTIREIENNDLPDFVAPIVALADAFSMSRSALIIAAVASVPPRPHLDQPPETPHRSSRVVPGDAAGAQEPDAQSTVDWSAPRSP